jgi:hypothetical protein
VKHLLAHPYKTTGKIIGLYILVFGIYMAHGKADSGTNHSGPNILLAFCNLSLLIVRQNIQMNPGVAGGDCGQKFGYFGL